MSSLRKTLSAIPFIKVFSSIKITVICLFLLFVLTFWGTIDQIQNGLYHAQRQFFYSGFFMAGGFLPFPGAKLVLFILFFNLVCVAITRFVYQWDHSGICIIHMGLLIYFISAYVTFRVGVDSNLNLLEGEGSNCSTAYHDWELSVWKDSRDNQRRVVAYDTESFQASPKLPFEEFGFNVFVKTYYLNAEAYVNPKSKSKDILNQSGISSLTSVKFNKEPEKNFPGGVFEINDGKGFRQSLLLYGKEVKPAQLTIGQETYNFILRRKKFPLPFTLTLKDFEIEVHPGTEVARSYKSKVLIENDKLSRDVIIYMNHPLRYKDFTLYQASYAIDAKGREYSTLAVVKNAGRILPYVASLLVFLGLVTHFLMMAFNLNKVRA